MPKYKITIAYDGTQYGGWQVQDNSISIQCLVQQALQTVLRTPIDLTGSGRTDAGVHALAQVAHFTTENPFDPSRVRASLNGLLPLDIRIILIEPTHDDFHARYSAQGKIYHYHLQLDRFSHPFNRHYTAPVFHPVNIDLLKQAASLFVGTHDFTSFANQAHKGSAARGAIRTLKRIDVIEVPGGVRLEFEGNGFLYKMVRNIVGTLLEVCNDKIPIATIPRILAAKDRQQAGQTAPAQGLFLIQVLY
jgi:tRNA pseudouridine38-40 synthase